MVINYKEDIKFQINMHTLCQCMGGYIRCPIVESASLLRGDHFIIILLISPISQKNTEAAKSKMACSLSQCTE